MSLEVKHIQVFIQICHLMCELNLSKPQFHSQSGDNTYPCTQQQGLKIMTLKVYGMMPDAQQVCYKRQLAIDVVIRKS